MAGTAALQCASRYTMPNGAVAGSREAGNPVLGVGSGASSLITHPDAILSLYDVAQPFKKASIVRLVVRATKGGVQETGDALTEFEVDGATGAIESTRSNKAFSKSISLSGLTLSAKGGVFEDDSGAAAQYLDLYVESGTITPGTSTPRSSITLASAGGRVQRGRLRSVHRARGRSVQRRRGCPDRHWGQRGVFARLGGRGDRDSPATRPLRGPPTSWRQGGAEERAAPVPTSVPRSRSRAPEDRQAQPLVCKFRGAATVQRRSRPPATRPTSSGRSRRRPTR